MLDGLLRLLAEQTENIVDRTELHAGGHFPGLEIPDLRAEDIIAFARGL